jgi:tetratricopeptide (TPR) repeat protein
VTGIGSGAYEAYWAQHGSTIAASRNAHSIVFEALAELGLAGLALVIAFLAVAVVAGLRRARAPGRGAGAAGAAVAVLVSGAVAAVSDWTYEVPAVFGLTILAAALLVGPATLQSVEGIARASGAHGRSRPRFATGVTVLLVAWVSICAGGLLLFYERSLDASRDAIDEGRTEDAIDSAEDASSLQPWAAAPRVELARAYEQAGDLGAAMDEIGAAIERAPEDWRHRVTEVRLAAEAGDAAGALAAYEEARRLNPRDLRLDLPLAEFYELIGVEPPPPS